MKLTARENTLFNNADTTIYDTLTKKRHGNASGRTLAKLTTANDFKDIYKQTASGLMSISSARKKLQLDTSTQGMEEWAVPSSGESTEVSKKNFSSFVQAAFKDKQPPSTKNQLSTSLAFDKSKRTLNNKVKSSEKFNVDPTGESNLYGGIVATSKDTDRTDRRLPGKLGGHQLDRIKASSTLQNNMIYSTSISNHFKVKHSSLVTPKPAPTSTSLLNASEDAEDCRSECSSEAAKVTSGKTNLIVQNIFTDKGVKQGASQPAKQSFSITINQFYRKDKDAIPEKPVKVQIQHG
jgi:hypothetical protein